METSDIERLRSLEDENGRLKRMLADAMLDNAALKGLLGKKWRRPLQAGKPFIVSRNSADERTSGV